MSRIFEGVIYPSIGLFGKLSEACIDQTVVKCDGFCLARALASCQGRYWERMKGFINHKLK